MILEQDLMKKKYWIWGLDGSGMEVDEKIVCRGSRRLFHLTVNSRGFPRQLTTVDFEFLGS